MSDNPYEIGRKEAAERINQYIFMMKREYELTKDEIIEILKQEVTLFEVLTD